MTFRYWKWVDPDTRTPIGIFRQDLGSGVVTMYVPNKGWIDKMNYLERVVTDTDFEEIDQSEASKLLPLYSK